MNLISKMMSEMERGFPVTRYPKIIPKVQDKAVGWKVAPECDARAAFTLGADKKQHVLGDCLVLIQEHLHSLMPNYNVRVPMNALTVSISMNNFTVGAAPQEFLPGGKKDVPDGAFFTYQMFSKHVQGTIYNLDGVEFLAGVCYYMQLTSSILCSASLDKAAINRAYHTSQEYPLQDRRLTLRFRKSRFYGRFCTKAGRRVRVLHQDGKEPVHWEYNVRNGRDERSDCAECREEAKEYKFEAAPAPAPAKKPVVVPAPAKVAAPAAAPVAVPETIVRKIEKLKVEPVVSEDEDFDFVKDATN